MADERKEVKRNEWSKLHNKQRGQLSRVEFDNVSAIDQLFKVISRRLTDNFHRHIFCIHIEPARWLITFIVFQNSWIELGILQTWPEFDLIADSHLVRWNINSAPIHQKVTMRGHLSRLKTGKGQTSSIEHIIQSHFQLSHEIVARQPLHTQRLGHIPFKLTFRQTEHKAKSLFLSKLLSVPGVFLWCRSSHTRTTWSLFQNLFILGTTKEVHSFTAAETSFRT